MATAAGLRSWRTCPRCGTALDHGDRSVSCPSCGLEEFANPAPTASAVVVDGEGRLLLARRAADPGRGLWDLPGGFLHEDEEAEAALVRELEEETGLAAEVGRYLGALPDTYGEDGIWTINFYWEARLAPGEPVAADDVAELVWFPREALPPRGEFAFANTVELLARAGAAFAKDHPDGQSS